MNAALSDVAVLDLTAGIAGPFCTKLLAGLGAEVIKIERPWGGDPARHVGPFLRDMPDGETSALFLDLNGGKKSVTLNLRSTPGAAIARELAAQADILVESFRPGAMERLGLGYSRIHAMNPSLTYTSLSNFGQTGPYRDYKGSDILFYGTGGEMYSTGLPDRSPIRLANYIVQYQAGNLAAAAALMDFQGVRRGGSGQRLDVSIYESAVSSVDRRFQYLVGYAYNRSIPNRSDNNWASYPTGVYPCKDGFIDIFGGGRQFFPRTCRMIGRPELVEDPRFASDADLIDPQRKDEFDAIFLPWAIEHTRAECLEAAQQANVYAAPMFTPEDVFHDSHYRERDYFVTISHPVVGELRCPGAPAKFSGTPWSSAPAPLLGEHTQEILAGRLGYSSRQLAVLRQAQVI
ncbi:MAG: CoA transferase [Dehalococcoidia bacterium]